MTDSTTAQSGITITRTFNAPRQLVWDAWTKPEHYMKWWGPKDFTAPLAKMDLRVGGKYLSCMQEPSGKKYWTTGEYLEIVPIEKLVYTDNFSDENGNVVDPSFYGMQGEWADYSTVTVLLEDHGDKTVMTLHHSEIPAGEMSEMTKAGWNESFDKMAESIKQ